MNNKKLKKRHFSKEIRLCFVNNKADLISKLIEILTQELPEDIDSIEKFGFNLDNSLPLLNCDFHVDYAGFETSEEYRERLIKEEASKNKRLKLLTELAEEFNYKLEKNHGQN
jgi:glycosylphosphatidylinositol transamidase (GPIT) subunit GPI8